MANFIHLAIGAFLIFTLSCDIGTGLPINPEDVQSLLPETPKTKNETVAAIVQDAVVQGAVQSFVGNGTLSGLVVKKNTVILPADAPDVILSQNEQILTAPLSHLEDIRKNITETAAITAEQENSEITTVDEISLAEVIPLNTQVLPGLGDPALQEVLIAEKAPENLTVDKELESPKLPTADQLPNISEIKTGQKLKVPGIVESEIKLPEGVFPQKITLPNVIGDEISEPVVAVVKPNNVPSFHGSVIALLPASAATESSGTTSAGVDSSENSNDDIVEFGARIPVAVITSDELKHPAVKIETRSLPDQKTTKNIEAVFTVPQDRSSDYLNDGNDMVAAEDIIFRPLFSYRQQQNARTRVAENRAYQRPYSYNRYRPSNSYGNYNSGENYRRKSHRARYYNDYY